MNEKFKHGGAPLKPEMEVLNKRITVRVRWKDLEKLDAILKQKKINRSDFARIVLLKSICLI